jgi:hypothetical protein
MSNNLEIAKQYLATIEQGVDCHKLAEFFAPESFRKSFRSRCFWSFAMAKSWRSETTTVLNRGNA